MRKKYLKILRNKLSKGELQNEGGFIIKAVEDKIDESKHLPDSIHLDCKFCKNMRINKELYETFKIAVCSDCKYKHVKLITKTTCRKDFLLTEEELRYFKYLEKANPNKNTYVDMQLYLLKEIEEFALKKYGSLEKIKAIKEERKSHLLERKKKKTKKRIQDLRRKTFIENKEHEKHKHQFKEKGGNLVCECGLIVKQEEL